MNLIKANQKTISISLSVIVSFFFVYAFAVSTTTISSNGLTTTGNIQAVNLTATGTSTLATTTISGKLGVGTTTDPLYALKIARGDIYLASSEGNNGRLVFDSLNTGSHIKRYDTNGNQRAGLDIEDTSARMTLNGTGNYFSWISLNDNSSTDFGMDGVANGSGGVLGYNFTANFGAMNTAGDGYTALNLDVTDAQVGATGARNLMDLQLGGQSRFKVGAGPTSAVVDATELVTNGTFDTASNWNFTGTWSWNTDHAEDLNDTGNNLSQSVPIIAGQTYLVTFIVSGMTPDGTQYMAVSLGGGDASQGVYNNGSFSFEITTVNTSDLIFAGFDGFSGSLDNVSVKKITPSSGIMTLADANGNTLPFRFSGDNISIGYETGQYLSDAWSGNDFFGRGSGRRFVGGYSNSFYGEWSGEDLQTGDENSGFGLWAGGGLFIGNRNSYLGKDSGGGLAIGDDNTILGAYAASDKWQRGNFSNDTFVGAYSGFSNLTGANNVFIGKDSGYSNTTGSNNFFGGYQAGYSFGYSGGTFLGYQAGYSFNEDYTSGRPVVVGNKAAERSTGGQALLAIGDHAGYRNTGIRNIFMGTDSGLYNASGERNIFLGQWAGQFNTVGGANIYMGYSAGGSNIGGSNNVSIGNFSLTSLRQTYLGAVQIVDNGAGLVQVNKTGHGLVGGEEVVFSDTARETISGYNGTVCLVTDPGDGNYFVTNCPYVADASVACSLYASNQGDRNTALGDETGRNNLYGSGNVFLGYRAGREETGSNKLYIENSNSGSPLIYGEFDNDYLRFNASTSVMGNFAIGTTTDANYGLKVVSNTDEMYFTRANSSSGVYSKINLNDTFRIDTYSSTSVSSLASMQAYVNDTENRGQVYLTARDNVGAIETFIDLNASNLGKIDFSATNGFSFSGATTTFAGNLDIQGTGTSTMAGNLLAQGNIVAKGTIYVADLSFANAFRFYEDPMPIDRQLATGTQSLKLTNQKNEDIFKIDENGNLTIKGTLLQATTTEQSVISQGLTWILDQFKTIGVTIWDGVVEAANYIKAPKVITSEFEMKDKSTGETYCVEMINGELQKTLGECGSQTQATQTESQTSSPTPPAEPTPNITATTTTATTTDTTTPLTDTSTATEPTPEPQSTSTTTESTSTSTTPVI